MILTEQIVDLLKSQPNCMIAYDVLKKSFGSAANTLRKLLKFQQLQKFIVAAQVPYRTIYPDATPVEWKMKKGGEKSIRVLQLREPNINVYDIWPRQAELDDDETSLENGFLCNDKELFNVDLNTQAYKIIEQTKYDGVTSTELRSIMGLTKLNARILLRNLERMGQVTTFRVDQGRQRTSKYILVKFESEYKAKMKRVELEVLNSSILPENIEAIDAKASEASMSEKSGTLCEDIRPNDLVVQIKRTSKPIQDLHRSPITEQNQTLRMVERMSSILKFLNAFTVIEDGNKLVQLILAEELKLGYKDQMCKRSMNRLLVRLSAEKRIALWSINLSYEQKVKELMFITHPHVDENNTVFISLIEKEKFEFLVKISNEKTRLKAVNERLKTTSRQTADEKSSNDNKSLKTDSPPKRVQPKKSPEELAPKKKIDQSAIANYGYTPKFIRMRRLHEFLFYLIHDYPEDLQTFSPEEAFANWKTIEPSLDYSALYPELSTIYSCETNWKMFVPPLLSYQGYPKGWAVMTDILLRIPLSIFAKVFNINFEVPGLSELLEHPIRKHYLLNYLPVEVQNAIVSSRKYVFSVDEVLRRLCCIGLVQIGPNRQKEKDQLFVYVNRRASLKNTVDSSPGYYQITNKEYPIEEYYFNTIDDIAKYWDDIYRICLNTKLGRRKQGYEPTKIIWYTQKLLAERMQPRSAYDVQALDNAEIPGDGLGAAGFDSSLFAHLQRNWTFKKISFPSKTVPTVNTVPLNKVARKRDAGTLVKQTQQKIVPIKTVVRVPSSRTPFIQPQRKRLRQPCYDDIDKEALSLMKKLRVDWRPDEDNFLLLCKVGLLYLCPHSRKQTITSNTIRDVLHWHLKSFDKTSRACQRRIIYMMKNEAIAKNVHSCVQEMRNSVEIKKKFKENLYEILSKKFPWDEMFTSVLKIVFIRLLHQVKEKFLSLVTLSNDACTVLLPDKIDDFYKMYDVKCEEYSHKELKYSQPTEKTEISVAIMTTLIHSSVCCAFDKMSWNIQLYDIYKDYPEKVLAEAMQKVRNIQLTSVNKTANQSKIDNRNLPLSSNPYHLSSTYSNMMITNISYEIFGEAFEKLQELLASDKPLKSSTFLQGANKGRCFLISELICDQSITCSIQKPRRMLVINPKQCQEDVTIYDKISSRFQEIFHYIPKVNIVCDAVASKEEPSKTVRISTEKPQLMEYVVHPVEKLMKSDETLYHFFCLLNCIEQKRSIVVDDMRLNEEQHCPFDCVMGIGNSIEKIISIIESNASHLNNIKVDQQEDILPGTVVINERNILYLTNKLVLQRYDCEDEIGEVDDHGLLAISLNILNYVEGNGFSGLVDRIKLDSNADEDVPMEDILTLTSKNDKITKMHDMILVSLCQMTVTVTKKPDDEYVKYGSLDVPKKVLKLDLKKKDALLEYIVSSARWSNKEVDKIDIAEHMKTHQLDDNEISIAMEMLKFIESKKEMGASSIELQEKFGSKVLIKKCLDIFYNQNMVMRAGVVDYTFVHWIYTSAWLITTYHFKRLNKESSDPQPHKLMRIGDGESSTSLRPNRFEKVTVDQHKGFPNRSDPQRPTFMVKTQPWLRVNGSLNRRVLDKWMGLVLLYCLQNPGISVGDVALRFNLMQALQVRHLLEYLQRIECVSLRVMVMKRRRLNLFSSYENLAIETATELDGPDHVFVDVSPDAVIKYGVFIGNKNYTCDFL
ncbi:hypothetical protein HA402_011177 [Bradysia odoriphaga]|nr:hypothetical protein HA402_011177 [Bradysia odoriphaga]